MKKLLSIILIFLCISGFANIQTKSQKVATQYQQKTGISAAETQNIYNLFVTYLTNKENGVAISPAVQTQVNTILAAIKNTTTPHLYANQVNFTVSGELTVSDPTYQQVWADGFNPNCITQGYFDTETIHYDVIEFSVTQSGHIDIEVMDYYDDAFLALYCSFDPLNPRNNLIETDDDSGSGLNARLEYLHLTQGVYYLVMTTWDENDDLGSYTIEFRSDNGQVVLGNHPVPISYWWIVSLFVLIGAGIVIRKFYF